MEMNNRMRILRQMDVPQYKTPAASLTCMRFANHLETPKTWVKM